jgi:hypothetical protein
MQMSDIAGWVGATVLVGAYLGTSAGILRPDARSFQLLNLFGSVGLGALAWTHRAWPSVALNTLWLFIAVTALSGPRLNASSPLKRRLWRCARNGMPTHATSSHDFSGHSNHVPDRDIVDKRSTTGDRRPTPLLD